LTTQVSSSNIERMSERRELRTGTRTDEQILAHAADLFLLERIQRGEITNAPELRMDLRRLARDELILVGFGRGSRPTLLPRATRLLATAHGESRL
jgi:hypothetical protein